MLIEAVKTLVDFIAWLGRKAMGIERVQSGLLSETQPDSLLSGLTQSASEPSPSASQRANDNVLQWFRGQLARDIQGNFDNSRSPDGSPMLPLRYRVGKPLVLTGALMRAAVASAQDATLAVGADVSGLSVIIPLAEPVYWSVHEFGTGNVPARPYLGPTQDTVNELAERMRDVMADNLTK